MTSTRRMGRGPSLNRPSYRCAICGGPVEDRELTYFCSSEGVGWEKTEASLLAREGRSSPRRSGK